MKKTYMDNEFRQVFRNYTYPDALGSVNPDEFMKYSKKSGAGLVFMDVKTQAYALYDTEILPKDPLLGKRDLAGEISDAARKYGLKWGAYIAPQTIESMYQDKMDWMQVSISGKPVELKPWKTLFCWNSPFGSHFHKMLREIAEKYRPHAFYIDGLVIWGDACFCRHCKEKYLRETGK